MRDLLITAIVLSAAIAALRKPWIGVMLWTWLSIMNPHRYSYGFAYDAPFAAIAAGTTAIGLFVTREKAWPLKGAPVVFFALFTVWITVSWLMGLDRAGDYAQWDKVMKVNVMVLVGLALLHNKRHILALAWVAAGSLLTLGAKGGAFTLLNGGNFRVWGPPGSFIEDNNEFGLALIMAIPLIRFLQQQVTSFWGRSALTVGMLLCAVSAIGSHSRGALLAIVSMAVLLWWRGKNHLVNGVFMVLVGLAMANFMPSEWTERMDTIGTYDTDMSALGRISAWWTAWGIAFDYPFGVGFNQVRQELFDRYSPIAETGARAAHSIYFLVLGNHGFIGLFLFLMVFFTTWRSADWLRTQARIVPEARWCGDLGSMCQVSLLGYAVGGAFLSLSYFDFPYDVMSLVVLARVWVKTKGWTRELQGVPLLMGVIPKPALLKEG